jgi:2-isopropylmalate synthase
MAVKRNQQVFVFDTTLRDGEQSPGASMNLTEKLEVARALELLGVDVIEAGFPITSPDDFEAVRAVSRQVRKAGVCGLARCVAKDIDRAAEAVAEAARGRIHVFLATSPIHREHKLHKSKAEVLRMATESVRYARAAVKDIQFSPEDATRTEHDFLAEVVEAVIDAGATVVNIPDTVGWTTPDEFRRIMDYLFEHVSNISKATIAVHCHNDLGMAVANTLSAVVGGARQVEVTVNGIGERAGNAALEEVIMAMRTRGDVFKGLRTGIHTELLQQTSRMVSRVTGLVVARNKPIVGENAFAHESGIHADGVLKERTTYEIMDPKAVGLATSKLVLGKHSGRHQFRQRLLGMGFKLKDAEIDRLFFGPFKELADRKKEVFDEDIVVLVESEMATAPEAWKLTNLQVSTASAGMPTASVELEESATGRRVRDAATGDGPVDAIFRAMKRLTGVELKLTDYQIRAVTAGTEAQGEVRLEARSGNQAVSGRGVSTDILEASARAYLSAINRTVAGRPGKVAKAAKKGRAAKKK